MLTKLSGRTLVVYQKVDFVQKQLESFLGSMVQPGSSKQAEISSLDSIAKESFENVAVLGSPLSGASLSLIMAILKPGGGLFLMDCSSAEPRSLNRLCLFAGFVDCSSAQTSIACKKPSYLPTQQDEPEVCDTKPKACKNCSCGRKEAEEAKVSEEDLKKMLESGEIKSNCGACYLGDEFRCASCPYRGLPAFKPGEKVVLGNLN